MLDRVSVKEDDMPHVVGPLLDLASALVPVYTPTLLGNVCIRPNYSLCSDTCSVVGNS